MLSTHVKHALKYPIYNYSGLLQLALLLKVFLFFFVFSVPSPFLPLLFVLLNVLAENVFQWYNTYMPCRDQEFEPEKN